MAGLSKKSVRHILFFRVQVVDDHIGVALVTGCEYNNLKVFAKLFETFDCIWPDVDSCLDFSIVGECNIQCNIMWHF